VIFSFFFSTSELWNVNFIFKLTIVNKILVISNVAAAVCCLWILALPADHIIVELFHHLHFTTHTIHSITEVISILLVVVPPRLILLGI
jgi:hypothetical protein